MQVIEFILIGKSFFISYSPLENVQIWLTNFFVDENKSKIASSRKVGIRQNGKEWPQM